jgi:GntR family transcriptional regulator
MPTPNPDAEWWTAKDIADFLGVDVKSVSAMRIREQMPPQDSEVLGRRVWRPATIVEWHAQRPKVHTRRSAVDRYRPRSATAAGGISTPFSRDLGTTWDDPAIEVTQQYRTAKAGRLWGPLLHIDPSDLVLVRHYFFRSDRRPAQSSRSALPFELVEGTPLTDVSLEPWDGGTEGQMRSIGVTVTGVREEIRARMPTTKERSRLEIPGGVPVFEVTRLHLAGERPVEAALIVIPADRRYLGYDIPVKSRRSKNQ